MAIFHLALTDDWLHAVESGQYAVSTRGAVLSEVGYIHASHAYQVDAIGSAFYSDVEVPLCVLEIDTDAALAAGVDIIEEDGGEGEFYPHIYGPIDPTWVTKVWPARVRDGQFSWG